MTKKVIISVIIVAVLIFIWYGYVSKGPIETGSTSTPQNAAYTIEGELFQLKDGRVEKEAVPGSVSKITVSVFETLAMGDLNGDGLEDSAILLTYNGGGSGSFYYIAAALKNTDGYFGTNAILLGDRIAPQPTEIQNEEIIVNYAERKPDEPMSVLPSVGISRYFKIEKEKLVEIEGTSKEILCPEELRGNRACIQVYNPVCATVQIQCIKAPCNPIKETFPSACEACGNPRVKSYTPGECRE